MALLTIPKTTKKYDLVIFGASGFTGRFVVEEVHKIHYQSNSFSFAVAGRSESKLKAVIEAIDETIPIIVADVADIKSLENMAGMTRVLINCVGPFKFHGKPVIEACINSKTHYVDISGEPQFMEESFSMFNALALKENVSIISACGFDSIPADIGVFCVLDKILNLNYKPLWIESIIRVENTLGKGFHGHFTTFESAVYGFSDKNTLDTFRLSSKSTNVNEALSSTASFSSYPKLIRHKWPFFDSRIKKWCVPFPGSDPSVVKRSISSLAIEGYTSPLQYAAYFSIDSLFSLIGLIFFSGIFYLLTRFTWGKSLLLKYPSFFTGGTFSHQGPSLEEIDSTRFFIKFFGHALKKDDGIEVDIKATLSGPEPGYRTTPICVVQAAMTILGEEDLVKKGVLTPVEAFKTTSFISNLLCRGITLRFD